MAVIQGDLRPLHPATKPKNPRGRDRLPAGDPELVEAVRAGDGAAFSILYRNHRPAVLQVVRSYVHERETAADLAQEAFVRPFERLPTLRQAERFRPWLLAIARHAAIDRVRTRWGERGLDGRGGDELASTSPGPDQEAELAELTNLVRGCLAGLPSRDATVLIMVTHLGAAPADVASVLGVTPGAAKVIVHRARRRLRDSLTLQLMAKRTTEPCAGLGALLGNGNMTGANRHVQTCQLCVEVTRRELGLCHLATPTDARGSRLTTHVRAGEALVAQKSAPWRYSEPS